MTNKQRAKGSQRSEAKSEGASVERNGARTIGDRRSGRRTRTHVAIPATHIFLLTTFVSSFVHAQSNAAPADTPSFRGFEAGLRASDQFPFQGGPSTLALTTDIGARVATPLYIGAVLGYGVPSSTDCSACSGHTIVLGTDVQYHSHPLSRVDPWIGGSLAYVITSASAHVGIESAAATAKFFVASAIGGFDLHVIRQLGIGPYASLDLSTFLGESINGQSEEVTGNTSVAFTIGVRGIFGVF
jgi:hypothetical protein